MTNKEDYSWFVPQPPAEQRRVFKDKLNRSETYVNWTHDTHRDLFKPDLLAYRRYLREERAMAPMSINAHIYTIRKQYRELLEDGTLRAVLEQSLEDGAGPATSDQDIDKILAKIQAVVSSREAILDAKRPEVEYRRLKASEIRRLLTSPETDKLVGKRDIAIFAVMLLMGLRASEVSALQTRDLYAGSPMEPALHVPAGRGCTERIIPYGRLIWGRRRVEAWLKAAHYLDDIEFEAHSYGPGPVFRGLYRGGERLRPGGLSPRSLDYVFNSYPIDYGGERITIRPMELRRANARLLFEAGFELETIKDRLGVTDNNTLMDYIGGSEANLGLPPGTDILGEYVWFKDND